MVAGCELGWVGYDLGNGFAAGCSDGNICPAQPLQKMALFNQRQPQATAIHQAGEVNM